ncbi:hypothetical protein ACN9M0_24750 [Streptomyces sp. R-07]|uniref:hypothetical protein n=1 Tax=Streptomyces sp. R-07 TaxID=3404052 RepID=UPI003CE6DC88
MGLITRAEDYYLPPPYLAPDAWADKAPALRCVLWYEYRQQRRIHTGDAFVIGQQLYARINHGRWLADCTCGSAQIVTPTDPRMWCVECGTGWWQLTFPADVTAVEESLAALPVAERNWWAEPDPARPTLEV